MVQFWKKLIRRAQSGIDTMTLIWHQRPYLEDQNWALLALSKYMGFFVLKNRTNYEWCHSLSVFIQLLPNFNPRKHCELQSSDQVATTRASVDWRGLRVPYLNPTAALQGPCPGRRVLQLKHCRPAYAGVFAQEIPLCKAKGTHIEQRLWLSTKQQQISKPISLCILPRFSLCNGNRSFLKSKRYSGKQTTMTKCGSQGSMRFFIGVSAVLYTLFTSL